MPSIALTGHPATPCERIHRFTVSISRTVGGLLALQYVMEGDLADVLLPDSHPPHRADELWRRTCREAFLAGRERAGYDEFNFAPTTAWAVDRFEAFRAFLRSDRPGCGTHITAG
jgi:hypothetical protein